MRWREFLIGLSEVTLACLVWALGLTQTTKDEISCKMYLIAILTYVIFCVGIFAFAKKMIREERHYTFNGVISISFICKLVISLVIVYLVEILCNPIGHLHILHYLIVYIVYTIFEVYFLSKMAKA